MTNAHLHAFDGCTISQADQNVKPGSKGNSAQFIGSVGDAFSAICCLQIFRFTSSKPSKSAIASDEKFIRLRTNAFVRYCLKWCGQRPPCAKRTFPRRAFPPLSTGPSLKTERLQRGRSCGTGGNPVRGAPARLHRHKQFVRGGSGGRHAAWKPCRPPAAFGSFPLRERNSHVRRSNFVKENLLNFAVMF